MECGRAYFLSHGIQTFCNQTTAPDTPQSPSRNRATNANMSPERIGRTHIPYTHVYPLTATSCVGRKELKPSQVSPRRWLVGQGRMQGNGCVSEYMLNGISSQETANNFGNREERNPQGQKSIGLTKTRQRPRPSSIKQEQISLV